MRLALVEKQKAITRTAKSGEVANNGDRVITPHLKFYFVDYYILLH